MCLCNNIRIYRERLGLSQSYLGKLVGVSKNAISSYERLSYCPSAYIAARLCSVFNCSFSDLFYFN